MGGVWFSVGGLHFKVEGTPHREGIGFGGGGGGGGARVSKMMIGNPMENPVCNRGVQQRLEYTSSTQATNMKQNSSQ